MHNIMIVAVRMVTLALFVGAASCRPAGRTDWLIEPTGKEVTVRERAEGREIVLSNGLISRRFRLYPNAATVGYENLMTGESMLRGVKCEALVELDGIRFDVGGLKGQPNYAYLLAEWIEQLQADPRAFEFAGYKVGPTKERFAWKRVRHSAPMPWPPPGKSLTLSFKLGAEALAQVTAGRLASKPGDRVTLVGDDLQEASERWEIHQSKHERSSFMHEGGFGRIHARSNTCVYAERELPAGAEVVQCRVDSGTDASASWGPGITLVWAERVMKFYLRPGKKEFGIFDGSGERLTGQMEPGKAYYLRIEIAGRTIFFDASMDGRKWFEVSKIELAAPLGGPRAVRLGKSSRMGGGDDFAGEAGEYADCRVSDFRAYGGLGAEAKAAREKKLSGLANVTVSVHYEMYEGIPLLSKWLEIHNGSDGAVRLNSFTSEILAMVEYESHVEAYEKWNVPNIHVETDYEFGGMNAYVANHTVHWEKDPDYLTQVSYPRENPCLLECRPPVGPDVEIGPHESFETFRTFELAFDSTERERKGLAVRRMYRTIAPWVTENPIMMHVRHADPKSVRLAIDQCAEVGFEMVILTFGSGFNIENTSDAYIAQMKELADYAHGKGIEIGGYSLLSSRSAGAENDVIDVETGRPGGAKFGIAPCIGSRWGQEYFRRLYAFFEKTGFDLLEHDGSYPGDTCASKSHPGHKGYEDSQWTQWKVISDFYKWCRGRGVYLNVPDFYYLAGSTKCGMGYRETNWSLPRAQQVIHGRQNIYDGTWTKTPSMGWMFVPLTQYHGGGAAATIEPLSEHLDVYEAHMANNFGAGVQACYRGPRLYDTDETKAAVKKWVDFFKKYRGILESDIIHVRRADGRDIDCILHVNPGLKIKALAMVYNPLNSRVKRQLQLPLYYSGLKRIAWIRERQDRAKRYRLDRDYKVRVSVDMGPRSVTWFVVR